jgi:hypothetical protein
VSIPFDITSKVAGFYHSLASLTADTVAGTTQVSQPITVTP